MSPNVLLINPSIGNASQNKRINRVVGITFPTSIGILAGCLMTSGIDVRILDEQIDPISESDFPRLISSMQSPRIVGISVLTLNSGRAYEVAQQVKQVDPHATVVLGGIHPTVALDEALHADGVDVVVRGEGEETFIELVQLILQGKDYRGISGISFSVDGKTIHTPNRPYIDNLDSIPPIPYHLFETDILRYPSFSTVLGSRGCPYSCLFCSSRSISGKKYRFHSVDRVVQDCTTLIRKYKQQSVFFADDNIAVDRRHFIELCDALTKEGLHKEAFFHASMRADNATDEILEKARATNFKMIYFGFETGIERLMKIIDKRETVAQIVEAIQRAHRAHISVGATLIFGLPTETRQDRYDTIKLVNSLPLDSIRFNTLVPYPGTPAYKMLAPQGKILIKGCWENFGVQYMWESDDIPYVPDESNRIELIFDTMYANLSYYLAPKGISKLIMSPVAGGNVIKLKKRWFLSLQELYKMGSVFTYLFARFLSVAIRMLWTNIIS
ncbi:MAG: radical SAM protein [Deltaproteobacteria bacterium]|nr:radical SAM protein [Deltaproteobacteria bacterium]